MSRISSEAGERAYTRVTTPKTLVPARHGGSDGGGVPRKLWNLLPGSDRAHDEWTNYRVQGIMRLPF